MKICEIFTSIQGESTHAGRICTFVRLTGCNLRCTYCDTAYAYYDGVEYTIEDVLKEVRVHGGPLVEVTGGEPLMQQETPELIRRLLDEGFEVLVETNGSMDIGDIDPRAAIILDMKLPSSGMSDEMRTGNLDILKPTDEVKFVIGTREDYEQAKKLLYDHGLDSRCTALFSPIFGVLEPRKLAGWMLEDRVGARLNLQLHKYIYDPEERGV